MNISAEEIEMIYMIKKCVESMDNIENNFKVFNQSINRLTRNMIEKKKFDFPTSISDFIKFIKNRKMNEYINDELPDEPFVNTYFEINEYILEITDEKNSEEKVQKLMKELLDICRLKNSENSHLDWNEIYIKARLFICENYLIEKSRLDIELNKNFPQEIKNVITRMYEKSKYSSGEIIVCPICKKPLDFENEYAGCSNICQYYRTNIESKKIFTKERSRLLNLNNGIYKYILLPNIGEYSIYTDLKDKYKDLDVKLYPNIDEFDISLSDGDICINLDVKDHKEPLSLVRRLKENTNLHKFCNDQYSYLVIPNHRVQIYKETKSKRYMKELNRLLQEEGLSLKVIQEKNLVNKIDSILGGIYE